MRSPSRSAAGIEAYLARDADDGAIDAHEEVVVVDVIGPQTVLVTRLYPPGAVNGAVPAARSGT